MQPRAETGQSLLELLEAGQKGEGCQSRCHSNLRWFRMVLKRTGDSYEWPVYSPEWLH